MSDFHDGFTLLSQSMVGVPERVPFTTQMHEFAMAWTDTASNRFYADADTMVAALVRTAGDFDFDIPNLGYDVYNIEAEALGQRLVYYPRQSPAVDNAAPLLAEGKNFSRLLAPEAGMTARMPFVLRAQRLYRELTGFPAAIQFCAPFSLAALLRGYASFIEDILTDPAFARDLLAFLTDEVIAPWINVQASEFSDAPMAVGADALCSPPMVNGEIISEFSIPYILRLRELCNVGVSVVNWWGDSRFQDLEEFLCLKLQVASGLIRAQDPDVAEIGPRPFKDFATRHGLVLELGVGDLLLNQGPVEAIEARIIRYIRQGATDGRLILYLSSIDATTPPEHVRAAVRAIKRHGRHGFSSPS